MGNTNKVYDLALSVGITVSTTSIQAIEMNAHRMRREEFFFLVYFNVSMDTNVWAFHFHRALNAMRSFDLAGNSF